MNLHRPGARGDAQAACAQLLVAFANTIGRNDHAQALSLFADDALLQRPDTSARGRDAIGALLRQRPTNRVTRHLCTNLDVSLQG